MLIWIEPIIIESCTALFRRIQPYLNDGERVQVQGLLRQTMVTRSADRETWEAMRHVLCKGQERRLDALARKQQFHLSKPPDKKRRQMRKTNAYSLAFFTLYSKKRGIFTKLGGR